MSGCTPMSAMRASIASSSASPASRPSSSRTTPACSVMVLRMARCRARTFSGAVGCEQRGDLVARGLHRRRRPLLRVERRRVRRRRLPDDASEDEQLDERVAAEAVGAVQPAGCLADGVEARDIGAVVLGPHPHAAHRVVRGGRDLDRLLRDVEHLQLEHGLVDAGQAGHDRLAGQVRDVQPDAAVRGAAALLDLGVAGERHAVAGGQLHALGVVARHEALAEAVAQDAALAARRLADQGAGRALGLDDARGVELHELGVAQPAAGLDGEPERVAGVLVAARRGAPPDAVVAAGGEDDRVGVDEVARAVFEVEAVGAEDRAVVVHEDARDVHGVEDRHVQLRGPVDRACAGSRGRCSRRRRRCGGRCARRRSAARCGRRPRGRTACRSARGPRCRGPRPAVTISTVCGLASR